MEPIDSEPEIWRRLGPGLHGFGSGTPGPAGCLWLGGRAPASFTADDPLAFLRPDDGEVPEAPQRLPGQEREEPEGRPEEDLPADQLARAGLGAQRSTNKTLVTAGFPGSSRFPAGMRNRPLH